MDVKAFPSLIVGVVVALVLAGACLPIFAETTSAEDTFTNSGFYRMSKITDDGDDVTITWDYTKPYIFVVNGVDTELPFGSTSGDIFPYTIMCSDTWGIRATIYNSGVTIDMVLFGASSNLLWYSSTTDGYNVTFTFSSGTFSVGRDGTSNIATQTYTNAYYLDANGPYIMKKGNVNAYLNEDSEIYATGRTSTIVSGVNMNINVNATIADGATPTLIYPESGYTISEPVVNATAVNSYINLYSFSNVTFKVSGTGGSGTATYGQVIIPYEVTAEKAVHPDGALTAILNILPILVIAGLVAGAVTWFIIRKK